MIKLSSYLGVTILLLLTMFLTSCMDDSKSESTVEVHIGYGDVDRSYVSCLEKDIPKYPNDYPEKYRKTTSWLNEGNLKSIAWFNEALPQLTFLQNQVSVETIKTIYSTVDLRRLEAAYAGKVVSFLKKVNARKDGTLLDRVSKSQLRLIPYTISAYNSGSLDRSAAFSIQTDSKTYDFIIVSQFSGNPGKIKDTIESTFNIYQNGDTAKFRKTELFRTYKLNYYLIAIEEPCTQNQKVYSPILVRENLELRYEAK